MGAAYRSGCLLMCVCVFVCVRWSVTLSVVLAELQSTETELQLQALPPNGGSVHECICVCGCGQVRDE